MNTYAKGYRNERKAIAEFEKKGFVCHRAKITRHGANDFFSHFDFVALKKFSPTYWVQVKSNYVSPKVIKEIKAFSEAHFTGTQNDAIIMVWKDRVGWSKVFNITKNKKHVFSDTGAKGILKLGRVIG